MPIETLIFFIAGESLAIWGIYHSLKGIVRIAGSERVWGEIISFEKLPEKEREPNEEEELPDYFIEVKYEYNGESYLTDSIIKKDIHYERGGKIKVFINKGKADLITVDYNTQVSNYCELISSIFIGLFIAWRSLFV